MPITFLQFCKIFRRIANFYILDEVKALDEICGIPNQSLNV